MTKEELYKIASSKPILTDEEVMDDIIGYDIEIITDNAWRKSKKIATAKINEAENADDWMSPDEFGKYLKNEIKRIYDK